MHYLTGALLFFAGLLGPSVTSAANSFVQQKFKDNEIETANSQKRADEGANLCVEDLSSIEELIPGSSQMRV